MSYPRCSYPSRWMLEERVTVYLPYAVEIIHGVDDDGDLALLFNTVLHFWLEKEKEKEKEKRRPVQDDDVTPPWSTPHTLVLRPDFPTAFTHAHAFQQTVVMSYRRGNRAAGGTDQWPRDRWEWVQEDGPAGTGAWAWVARPHTAGDAGQALPNPIFVYHMSSARLIRYTLQRLGRGEGAHHHQAHVPDLLLLCLLLQKAGVGTVNLGSRRHGPPSFTVDRHEAMTRGWYNPANELC